MNSHNIFIKKSTRRQLQPEPGGRSAVNDDSRNVVASDKLCEERAHNNWRVNCKMCSKPIPFPTNMHHYPVLYSSRFLIFTNTFNFRTEMQRLNF